jgi:hypothetical protein
MIARKGLVLAAFAVGAAAGSLTAFAADYAASSTGGSREPVASRLNGTQYRQIIADVFGPTIEIGGRFEPGVRQDGLLAVGNSRVTVTTTGLGEFDKMARSIATQVTTEPQRSALISCTPKDAKKPDAACAKEFLGEVGRLLYRRPLTKDELKAEVDVAAASATANKDFYAGLATGLWTMLISPDFLFREEFAEADPANKGQYRLDAYSRASRLSFFLWNAAPDPELLTAAEKGELNKPEGLQRQVDRMIASPRLEGGVRAFFTDMLGYDKFEGLAKDVVIFPKFNFKVAAEAEEQTLRTIADHLVTQRGDYRALFTTPKTFMSPMLASIYSVPVDPEGGWQAFEFPKDDPRTGILAHISFTALHSHPGRSSPTLRGKALRELLLCQKVPDPPGNVDFTLVEDADNPKLKTARERLKAHASEAMCAGCHKIMDPIGLALEHFDSSGGYRTSEHGASIDTTGELDGQKFTDAADLGRVVANHPAAPQCLVTRMYSYGVGRAVERDERDMVMELQKGFAAEGYRVPDLMRHVALSDQFYRVAKPGEAPKANKAKTEANAAQKMKQEARQ